MVSLTRHERYNRSPKGRERYLRYYRANKRRVNLARSMRERAARIQEIEEALA